MTIPVDAMYTACYAVFLPTTIVSTDIIHLLPKQVYSLLLASQHFVFLILEQILIIYIHLYIIVYMSPSSVLLKNNMKDFHTYQYLYGIL